MKYYLDIILHPDNEVPANFLMGKVYTQLHLAFVENKNEKNQQPVGVVFPEYSDGKDNDSKDKKGLGKIIRLIFKSESDLENLNLSSKLESFSDYVTTGQTKNIPADIQSFIRYKRVQPKISYAKLKRLLIRKLGESDQLYEELNKQWDLVKKDKKNIDLPFVELKSLSSNNRFKLFLFREYASDANYKGDFNLYGLNDKVALPNIPKKTQFFD